MAIGELRRRVLGGELVVGTMVFEFGTSGIARIAAAAGAEFVIFDTEHTGWTGETTRILLASAGRADIVPMVRVTSGRYDLVAPQLDLGARGVMVPMVESAAAANDLVSWTRYPPAGRRGAAFAVAHDDYAGGDIDEKMRVANDGILTIAQIETLVGLENVEAIAATGVDVLFVGPFDLSSFLGFPVRFDDPAYTDAVDRVIEAAKANDKALGILVASVDEARRWIDRGFTFIAYGGDIWLYQQALRAGIDELKGR